MQPDKIDIIKSYTKAFVVSRAEQQSEILEEKFIVDAWNIDKSSIDKNKDGILQYVMLQDSNNVPIAVTRTKNAISTINNAGIRTEDLALVNANFNKELVIHNI